MRRTLETVARRYSELFESADELSTAGGSLVFTGGEDDPETLETLRRLGFQTPEAVTETVRGWHFGRFAAMRSTAARESLTEITPALLKAFSRAGNPDAAVRAFDSLLQALPAGAQLFALLSNNPRPARSPCDSAQRCAAARGDLCTPTARRRCASRSPRPLGEVAGRGRDRERNWCEVSTRREAMKTCSTGRGCSPPSDGS